MNRASALRHGVVAISCSAAIAGCGGSGAHSGSTRARPRSNPPSALATFNCTQWLAAPRSLRAAVLRQLHGFYGGAVSGQRRTRGYGTVLSDAQAARLFDSYCRQPFARNFTLYRLYARAAAFNGAAP